MPLAKVIILPLALLLLLAGSGWAEPVTINFGQLYGQDSLKRKAGEYFKRLVEQRSNNRIQVRISPAGPLSHQHSLEALKANNIQMAAPEISELYTLSPQLRLFDLPFLFDDVKHLHHVIDGEVGTELLESASQGELVALSFWDNGFRQLTANRPLRRPLQAAGLSFQITGSAVLKKQFAKLGAEPQSVPPAQLYSALADKRIEGQENTLANIDRQKLYQVQSDLTISNHRYTGYLVVTNRRFWSQLPEDLKVIVKGAIKDAAEYTRDMAAQISADALKKIAAAGSIEIHRLSPEERRLWREQLQEINPKPYNRVSADLVRKAREKQIR